MIMARPKGKKPSNRGRDQYSKRQRDIESLDMRKGSRVPAECDMSKRASNDPTWYAFNPQLMRDTASFPYSWPLGAQLATGDHVISNSSVPGIMVFYCNFSVGNTMNAMSPANTAARNIYSYVRHANSGHANYESTDLMLYLLAMDSAYSLVSFMKRAYGVLSLYAYENRYYNDAILHAMRLDADDFRRHIADFRAFINTYAVRIGSMCIPNSMSYMARHMWMYQNLYLDSETAKAQTYFYSPNMFYQYGLDKNGLGMLKFVSFARDNTNLWTFSELSQFALDLIAPILSSEDCNIMSGDILKAFGESGVYKIAGVDEAYQSLPVYDKEVQSQIENLTMLGNVDIDTEYDPNVSMTSNVYQIVVEDQGVEGLDSYLFSNPSFSPLSEINNFIPAGVKLQPVAEDTMSFPWATNLDTAWTQSRFVNLHHGSPTPDDTMVATRLTNMLVKSPNEPTTGQAPRYTCPTLASDYVTHAAVYWYSFGAQGNVHLTSKTGLSTGLFSINASVYSDEDWVHDGDTSTEAANRVMNASGVASQITAGACSNLRNYVSIISNFDWHPGFYLGAMDLSLVPLGAGAAQAYYIGYAKSGGGTALIPFEDLDYYTIIDANGLRKMAETALLSMFSVPQMGAFARKI